MFRLFYAAAAAAAAAAARGLQQEKREAEGEILAAEGRGPNNKNTFAKKTLRRFPAF